MGKWKGEGRRGGRAIGCVDRVICFVGTPDTADNALKSGWEGR